jgi:hypothetical protein
VREKGLLIISTATLCLSSLVKLPSENSSDDGSVSGPSKKGIVSPFSVTAPGAGPSPPNQPENRQPVFPSSQSDPNVFDASDPSQPSRMLTTDSANVKVTFRPGFGGPDGVTSDGTDKQTINSDNPPPEAFPQGVKPSDAGGGSPFGIGPQSESYTLRSRVVKNPARKGETSK